MKPIFIYFLSGVFLISCKPKTANTSSNFDKLASGIESNTTSKKGWSSEDKNKLMEDCVRKPGEEKGGTNEQCQCLLAQAEKYFSSFQTYDQGKEDDPEWKLYGDDFNKGVEKCRSDFPDKKSDIAISEKKDVDLWGDTKEDNKNKRNEVIIITEQTDKVIKVEKKAPDKIQSNSGDIKDNVRTGRGWSSADKRRFMTQYPSNSTQLRQCWLKIAETYYDSYEEYSNAGSKSTEYYRALLDCRSKYPN